MNEIIRMSGRVSGTVAEMKGRNLLIDYGSSTSLRFDFDISGLPVLADSYLFIDFTDMRTSAADVERFRIPGKSRCSCLPLSMTLANLLPGKFHRFHH
jgi:hypothetical protein